MRKILFVIAGSLAISGCAGLFDRDNTPKPTPLVTFNQTIHPKTVWSTQAGSGAGKENVALNPVMNHDTIFTTSANGTVTAIDKQTGRMNWQIKTGQHYTSGPGVGDGLVIAASRRGRINALDQSTGRTVWQSSVKGEIIANPAIKNGAVIIKDVDGHLYGLSSVNGQQKWVSQQSEPVLILRGSSSPALSYNYAFTGFANGNLLKLNITDGRVLWVKPIATPEGAFNIQRMIDIDANPLVSGSRVFAATYQGQIASLDAASGRTNWSSRISTYTGMSASQNQLFVTDASGDLWAFNADSGKINWRQKQLQSRVLSAPAVIGQYVIVGDKEGYVHWLNQQEGQFAARTYLGSPIAAAPLIDGTRAYLLGQNGALTAYQLG